MSVYDLATDEYVSRESELVAIAKLRQQLRQAEENARAVVMPIVNELNPRKVVGELIQGDKVTPIYEGQDKIEYEYRPGVVSLIRRFSSQESYDPLAPMTQTPTIRKFGTGATRDTAEGKNAYEGYLSPLVLEAYGDYMTTHRKQSDGSLRASDNWQKGIPLQAYRDSLIRHIFTAWALWRGWPVKAEMIGGVMRKPTLIETLNGVLFNTMGMMHEMLKAGIEKNPTEKVA